LSCDWKEAAPGRDKAVKNGKETAIRMARKGHRTPPKAAKAEE